MRQADRAPGNQSIWDIEWQVGILIWPDDRRTEVTKVGVEIIQVAARSRTDIGNKELVLARQMKARSTPTLGN